jgi:hypothetical protein
MRRPDADNASGCNRIGAECANASRSKSEQRIVRSLGRFVFYGLVELRVPRIAAAFIAELLQQRKRIASVGDCCERLIGLN